MISSARLGYALRRSLQSTPRAASLGAAGLRQACTAEPSTRRLVHGQQLLPRLFMSSNASGQSRATDKNHFPPPGMEADPDLEREYKRCEEKRTELIRLFIKALDTCDPAHRNLVMEKHMEAQQVHEEFLAKAQDVQSRKTCYTDHGATRSKTPGGEISLMSVVGFLHYMAGSICLGFTLSNILSY